jgi:hypothetical protein
MVNTDDFAPTARLPKSWAVGAAVIVAATTPVQVANTEAAVSVVVPAVATVAAGAGELG